MYKIERIHCDAAIQAVLRANVFLMNATAAEARERREVYGKGDTLGLDVIPETNIASSSALHDRALGGWWLRRTDPFRLTRT